MGFAYDYIHAVSELINFSPIYWTMMIAFASGIIRLAYLILFPRS